MDPNLSFFVVCKIRSMIKKWNTILVKNYKSYQLDYVSSLKNR